MTEFIPGKCNQGVLLLTDTANVPAGCTVCSWCQKVASSKQLFSLKTPTGQKAFCSEVCFTQCRRANFKRNKTCDWCRHVRHTVNYVDFQDGEHQLQFCRWGKLQFWSLEVYSFVRAPCWSNVPHFSSSVAWKFVVRALKTGRCASRIRRPSK